MLFNSECIPLNLPQANITYYPNFFSDKEAYFYFDTLLKTIAWQQDNITLFGKTHLQPRLTALYGDNNKTYNYSGITMKPQPFTDTLQRIKTNIEIHTKHTFTTCLANLYRNGNDSNGWHADNEKELGKNPIIASVSFGAERYFHLRHINDKKQKTRLNLENGSLLLMKDETQHFWQHQIPKTKKAIGKRINLTFRIIK